MFQALCEELTRKAATLVAENENLKRIARSINTEVEKTPVEHVPFVVEIKPSSGNGPWFLYNHFLVSQIFWPSILQSSNLVHLQNTSFNSIAIPPNANVSCSS
ncbi:hypothetical protein JHK85_044015 [Glycine max]|nr:hypothetical protein JHK85_044015 [Glycine max]